MRPNYLITILSALALGSMIIASPVLANPGDVDTGFNGGVPAVTDPGSGNYLDPFSAAVNPLNGDILFTGNYSTNSGVIEAYKANGTLDSSFGNAGQIIFDASVVGFPGGSLNLNTIAVDSQGRIIATGSAFNSTSTASGMLLMRLKSDGSFDTSFGANGNGYVLTQAYYAEGTGISFTIDGHIVVTGDQADISGSPDTLSVWRFKADGTPDSNFGNGGQVEVPTITDGFYLACTPALQPDGTLLVGCTQDAAGTWTMTRFMSDGTLDTSFGNSGMVMSPAGQYSLLGLSMTPEGKIMAAEGYYNSGNPVGELHRYLADGSEDSSFNGGSPQNIGSIPYFDSEVRIVVQPDDKTLVTLYNGTNALPIMRYLANGGLDNSFGSSGSASVDFSNIAGNSYEPVARAIILQADGKVLVTGWGAPSPRTEDISFVTRLESDAFSFTPAAFSFTDQTGVTPNSTITSNMITVAGLSNGVSVPVTVVGGEYRINGGAWTSNPGFTQNGDQIAVRQTSSGSYGTKTTTTLNVGGYAVPNDLTIVLGSPSSADFTATTATPPPTTPPPGGGSGGGGTVGPFGLLVLLLALVPGLLGRKFINFV